MAGSPNSLPAAADRCSKPINSAIRLIATTHLSNHLCVLAIGATSVTTADLAKDSVDKLKLAMLSDWRS